MKNADANSVLDFIISLGTTTRAFKIKLFITIYGENKKPWHKGHVGFTITVQIPSVTQNIYKEKNLLHK